MILTIGDIAKKVGGTINGAPDVIIHGPAQIEEGEAGCITFFANPRYESYIYTTACSAILVPEYFEPIKEIKATLIRVKNSYEAFGKVLHLFANPMIMPSGISPLAFVDPTAKIDAGASIGPHCYIGSNVIIGPNTCICAQVYIGNDSHIGSDNTIYPGVKIYHNVTIGHQCTIHSNAVIGSDGFGFSQNMDHKFHKIPQVGKVVIGNNVEIGACSTIDRATIGKTVIEDGVKIDNMVQVAHNVSIGKNTAIAAQTGIAGSTKIGARCLIGGQVGFVGHIEVADGSVFQAKTGVASSIKEQNKKYYGYPAIGYQEYLRSYAYFRKFPEIVDKVRQLEKELDLLRNEEQ